jgi:hypothetical protein
MRCPEHLPKGAMINKKYPFNHLLLKKLLYASRLFQYAPKAPFFMDSR